MIILYDILILLVILVVWDTVRGIHFVFTADASDTKMIARVGLQRPILSVEVQKDAPSPMLLIRLFKIQIISINMAARKKQGGAKKGLRLARAATISGLAVSADYGLGDPFYTAMALPAAGAVAGFLPFEQLDIEPDFLSVAPFLSIKGDVTVKVGKTIVNYIQNK